MVAKEGTNGGASALIPRPEKLLQFEERLEEKHT
jgi:hypothetical protein